MVVLYLSKHPIYGGFSKNVAAGYNTIKITGGNIDSEVYGGYSAGDTIANRVIISSGNITESVYGGYSSSDGWVGLNYIDIYGGQFDNVNIYGGYALKFTSARNEVRIYGNPKLDNAYLYGGGTFIGDSVDNTLNIYTKGLTAKNIDSFQNINFYIPVGTVNGDTILTLTETTETNFKGTWIHTGTNLIGVKINAGVMAGNNTLNNGDTVILLTNEHGLTTDGTTYGKLTEGVSLTHDLTVSRSSDGKSIVAQIGSTTTPTTPTTPVLNKET